jgi:hypothetical protein
LENPMRGQNEVSGRSNRLFGIGVALVAGAWFVCLAIASIRAPGDPDATAGAVAGLVGVTVFLAGTTVAGIGMAARQPWSERLFSFLFDILAHSFNSSSSEAASSRRSLKAVFKSSLAI